MSISQHSHILGRSVQGRAIEGLFLGPDQPKQLDTLLIGAFHGDETISAELLQHWQNEITGSSADGFTVNFEQHPVLVIPVFNPDGFATKTRTNANGVDLNRNYPTPDWQETQCGTKYYSGPTAASEPETQLMIALLERYQPRKIVSIHSPYKVINYDGPAKALAECMATQSGYPIVESIGYPTPGSFGTYAGVLQHIPVITLELPPGFDEPDEAEAAPPESLAQVWADNHTALLAAITYHPIHTQ